MKFVDILVRELQEWPIPEHEFVVQECDGELYFYKMREDAKYSGDGVWLYGVHGSDYPAPNIFLTRADDWGTSIVSKSEWQSARAAYLASIQPARDPEIAAVVDKPANPWRRNRGRKTPPVPDGVIVNFKLRGDVTCYSGLAENLIWEIDGNHWDIMQWRYAEPQQVQGKPMAQTIEQVIDNAEAAAAAAFNPIALRDEYKRITAEGAELSQKMAKLNERMEEIAAELRAEGFALVAIDQSNR